MTRDLARAKQPKTFTDRVRAFFAPIIDPIVTVLAAWKWSPNALTITGMIGHFLTSWFVSQGQMIYAGLSLMLIGPLDALDGALARKRKLTQGGFGAFLDSTLDRLAEIILFGGFIYYFHVQQNQWMVMVAYLALTGSLMVSYSRGRAEGLGFDGKKGLLGRLERYLVLILLLLINQPIVCLIVLALFTYFTVAQRMVYVYQQARDRRKAEDL
ncbi:MAG: CDP-alcohol phosphatidyltransferase family protein [Ardenticatenaceae bacterium]|nr:CDP-alcohol phosphatidyltransferase family protein [Ardenticatenaceae bacterium]